MRDLYFFLGTEAEFIKMFPVIIEAKKRGLNYKLIASGQNDVANSKILKTIDCGEVDLELSFEKDIKKSASGLLIWWIKTYESAVSQIKNAFPNVDFTNGDMIVHGDTVSTYMGAKIGKKLGMRVCHIEAGLRSHHLFSPFPEEIDRLLTSRLARLHFAPGNQATENLNKVNGKVINTIQNTLIDSLRYSETIPLKNETISSLFNDEYFVFVMHRQENLAKKDFVFGMVDEIKKAAQKRKCVILLHAITKNTFMKFNLLKDLEKNQNIIMFPRVDYFDFMKLLKHSAFVLTDGGSNQEELYYMRKPCLILRNATERNEGIGINARLFNGSCADVETFIGEFEKGIYDSDGTYEGNPSSIIIESLMCD